MIGLSLAVLIGNHGIFEALVFIVINSNVQETHSSCFFCFLLLPSLYVRELGTLVSQTRAMRLGVAEMKSHLTYALPPIKMAHVLQRRHIAIPKLQINHNDTHSIYNPGKYVSAILPRHPPAHPVPDPILSWGFDLLHFLYSNMENFSDAILVHVTKSICLGYIVVITEDEFESKLFQLSCSVTVCNF